MEISALNGGQSNGAPLDLPEGAFLGKSIPQCIKLYLSAARKKKTVKEITTALIEGGVESTSSKFENTVTSSLNRLKLAGEVLRFRDGWGLPDWYPAHIRASTPATGKRPRKKRAKKAKRKAGNEANPGIDTIPPKGKANERAIDLLRSGKKADYGLMEIGAHLGMGMQGARLILGKLIKAGKVEKTAHEAYRIPQPKLVSAGD